MEEVLRYTDDAGDEWDVEVYDGTAVPPGTEYMGTKGDGCTPQLTFMQAPLEVGGAIATRVRSKGAGDGVVPAVVVLTPDEVTVARHLGMAPARKGTSSAASKGKKAK